MFLINFMPDQILNMVLDWVYQQIVNGLAQFFGTMNESGYNLFAQPWVMAIVQLFSKIGWALFVTGIVVAVFEFAIEAQSGRANPRGLALNIIKGFFAVNLFTVVPVQLFALSVDLQKTIANDISGIVVVRPHADLAQMCLDVVSGMLFDPLLAILIIIMMAYAIVKVFFDSLKRGGILLIQISVGSLYMFSVPRGNIDGFVMWVKQVIATCLTSFLQSTMLTCGLILFNTEWIMGLGIILAAGEIPRIAGMFGLETGTRPNINGVINTAQSAVHLGQMISAAAK